MTTCMIGSPRGRRSLIVCLAPVRRTGRTECYAARMNHQATEPEGLMSAVNLQGFVYGEDRDGARSLGFKLLAPTSASWAAEVEGLARSPLAPYSPDTWPPAELFCSVLLEGGQRLVGVARYGLHDHTAGERPGGMEFLGIVGPPSLDVATSRSVAAWLRRRRGEVDDPRSLAGTV